MSVWGILTVKQHLVPFEMSSDQRPVASRLPAPLTERNGKPETLKLSTQIQGLAPNAPSMSGTKATYPDAVEDDVSRPWNLIIQIGAMHAVRCAITPLSLIKGGNAIGIGSSAAWRTRRDLWKIHDRCLADVTDAIPLQQSGSHYQQVEQRVSRGLLAPWAQWI